MLRQLAPLLLRLDAGLLTARSLHTVLWCAVLLLCSHMPPAGIEFTCVFSHAMSCTVLLCAVQVREIDLSRTGAALPMSPEALAAAAAATSSLITAGLPCAGVLAPDDAECVVCLDCLEVPVVTPCGHWFCKVGAVEESNRHNRKARYTGRYMHTSSSTQLILPLGSLSLNRF